MARRLRATDRKTDLRTEVPPAEVKALRPDPAAWMLAMHYAGGDPTRCQIVDRQTVIVRNNGR